MRSSIANGHLPLGYIKKVILANVNSSIGYLKSWVADVNLPLGNPKKIVLTDASGCQKGHPMPVNISQIIQC
jgi:hypothetical protein